MMDRFSRYKWLLIIIVVAAFLRLWQLGVVPPSPDWDEVALGYNAYSLLKTGRDEYGTWFPRSLRSYDDYKPPLYVYLTIPSVAVFGLNTWSVRLPSAVIGVLAVVGTYFLVVELFKSLPRRQAGQIPMTNDQQGKKSFIRYCQPEADRPLAEKLDIGNSRSIALLSAMLLAISPWHLQFSRIAFEANTGVTLNIWAVVAFLKSFRFKGWLSVSAVLFGLSFYAYHSERIFTPFLVVLLIVVFRKQLFIDKLHLVRSMLIGLLIILPLIPQLFNASTLTRLRGTSALADQTLLLARSVSKIREDKARGDLIGPLFDNRRIVWFVTLLDGYLSHYSFRWLFFTGDNPRHHAPDMGLLYLWEAPFLLWGMYTVARRGSTIARVLFGWFLIAPIAASPTTELPHAIRTLVFLPTFQIFTAVGVFQSVSSVKYQVSSKISIIKKGFLFLLITSLLLLVAFNLIYYFHMYFGHMNREVSKYWQYGYKQAVEYANANYRKYKKIIVSTELEQPHMFSLYYLGFDPKKYLEEGGTRSGGFEEVKNRFDIFEFRPIDWDLEKRNKEELYIGTPKEIRGTILESINYLDGSEAIRIAEQ